MMETEVYVPKNKVRIVTAASLFDGHDAAINVMRRIIQSTGCEVIHLGHDRSPLNLTDRLFSVLLGIFPSRIL
jgi:methylmalonyl-CoA mutase